MSYSEGFSGTGGSAGASGAGASGAGASGAGASGAGSAGASGGPSGFPGEWVEDATHPSFTGRVWEGTDAPAPAGPWGVVEVPATSDLESLDQAVDTLERLHELQCWAEAQKARLVDRIREFYELTNGNPDARMNTTTGVRSPAEIEADQFAVFLAAEEVGALLRLPARSARTLVEQSRLLVERHERTLASLEDGKLSWRHASTVVEECVGVPADALPAFEQDLVSTAETTTVPKLARQARARRELLHPQAAPVRKTRAKADRRVLLEPDRDGMAWLSAYLPAEQACGIYNRLDAAARSLQCPDEERTLTQLRADVFSDLLTHTCTGDDDGGTGYRGIGASVHITVPALTLLERMPGAESTSCSGSGSVAGSGEGSGEGSGAGTGEATGTGSGAATGEATGAGSGAGLDAPSRAAAVDGDSRVPALEGYGPIDVETAARLAGHAPSLTRILTHPETGALLSIGRASYRPPKHLQDWVRERDKTCRHPGCNRSATASEIDHTVPWHQGGQTDHDNLACLCKAHHTLKTNGHWRYGQPEPGIITATSPAGKTYTTQPPPF